MIRPSTLLWVGLAGAVGFGLFQLKHEVQALEDEMFRLNRAIIAEQQAIHVLKAEWSYINQPQRLQTLAARHLDLQPMAAGTDSARSPDLPMRGDARPVHCPSSRPQTPPQSAGKVRSAKPLPPAAAARRGPSRVTPVLSHAQPVTGATLMATRLGDLVRHLPARLEARGHRQAVDRDRRATAWSSPAPCSPSPSLIVALRLVDVTLLKEVPRAARRAPAQDRAADGARRHRRPQRRAAGDLARHRLALRQPEAGARSRRRRRQARARAAGHQRDRAAAAKLASDRSFVWLRRNLTPRAAVRGQPPRHPRAVLPARGAPRLSAGRAHRARRRLHRHRQARPRRHRAVIRRRA